MTLPLHKTTSQPTAMQHGALHLIIQGVMAGSMIWMAIGFGQRDEQLSSSTSYISELRDITSDLVRSSVVGMQTDLAIREQISMVLGRLDALEGR